MKKFPEVIKYRILPLLFVLAVFSLGSYAQDIKVEKAGNDIWNWLSANWKWVVGIIVLLIVISAIAGGGRRRTTVVEDDGTGRVIRTTTTTTDY